MKKSLNEEIARMKTMMSVMGETVMDEKVYCDECPHSWDIAKGGNKPYICHKCGHDNEPQMDEYTDPTQNISAMQIANGMMGEAGDPGYLSWKRKNVTIRGVKEAGEENNAGAMLGRGLYTAFLSNKDLAKQYGQVYFVLNAIPKNPKVFNTLNEWEIWFYNTLVFKYSKEQGKEYPDKRDFNANTTIEDEMQKLGHDGIVIKGREMVNFNPPENVVYFKNEQQLINYYEDVVNKQPLNENTFSGEMVWSHIKSITPNENDIPWGFKDKIKNAQFTNMSDFKLNTLLQTDPDFMEYYESGDVRYSDEDDIDPSDIDNEIVVVNGELLDGYSRAATLLRRGVETTNAFVGKSDGYEVKALDEYVRKIGDDKWRVYSEKGKNLGTYNSQADAKKRLQQVHYFKNK